MGGFKPYERREITPEEEALGEEALANGSTYSINTNPKPEFGPDGKPVVPSLFVKKPNSPDAAKTPESPTYESPPPSPGGGTETSANDDSMQAALAGQGVINAITNPIPGGGKGPTDVVQSEGEDYLPIGGTEGAKSFDRAYVSGPRKLAEAFEASGKAQSDRAEALKSHYERQAADETQRMAVIQARQKEDNDQMMLRQRELDSATTKYSDDLANQGKFWENPGNVVSAIAFSLMPIFSNDPTIGVKLINQAIDRDMSNRRHLADMHLGELRSNVANYRKLAQDRQAGDLLAQSEAHRIAAMDVERIAQQFESPISRAKAQAIIQDQNIRMEQARQQAYSHYIYNAPRRMDPRIAKGFATGVDGAWSPFGQAPAGPVLKPGSQGYAVQGSIGGTPSTANETGKSLTVPEMAQAARISTNPNEAARAIVEGRIPGGWTPIQFMQASVARQASAETGLGPGDKAYEVAKKQIVDKAMASVSPAISEQLNKTTQQRDNIARLQRDMDIIGRSTKDPNAFMNMVTNPAEPQAFANWYNTTKQRLQSVDPANPAAKREREVFEAAQRFHQMSMMGVVEYYHAMAGANQSPGEEARLQQIIHSRSSWQEMNNFVNARSTALQSEYRTSLAHVHPIAQMVLSAQFGIGQSKPVNSVGIAPPLTASADQPEHPMTPRSKEKPAAPQALPPEESSNYGTRSHPITVEGGMTVIKRNR